MRFLGFIFVGLVLSSLIVYLQTPFRGGFLDDFLNSGFLETFAALAGFNIAAVIFLLGQLMDLQKKIGNGASFEKSKKEIPQNSYFLLSAFALSFLLLSFRPDPISGYIYSSSEALSNQIYYGLNVVIVCLFLLGMYSIFEILKAVFKLSDIKE